MSEATEDRHGAGETHGRRQVSPEESEDGGFKVLNIERPSHGEAQRGSDGPGSGQDTASNRCRCCGCFPLRGRFFDVLRKSLNFRKTWEDVFVGRNSGQTRNNS